MANGFIVIDEKDWDEADSGQREWMTFKTLKSIDARLGILEKRPFLDKAIGFCGAVIGGGGVMWLIKVV